jgi:hypothetical protein
MWQMRVLEVADGSMSPGTKNTMVSISLCHNFKSGQCNPSYATLARRTGVKLAVIAKHLKQGEDAGFLRRISTQGRHSNSYELIFPDRSSTADARSGLTAYERIGSTTHKRRRSKIANPLQASTPTTYEPHFEPPTIIHTNTEVLNKEKNSGGDLFPSLPSVVIDCTTTDFFKRFYAAYPRKKAPGDAEVALGQVLKKKQATEAEIMAGVERLVQHFARRPKADRIYIPYPAKWLRDRAWADELDEPRPSRATIQTDELNASVSMLQRWAEQ